MELSINNNENEQPKENENNKNEQAKSVEEENMHEFTEKELVNYADNWFEDFRISGEETKEQDKEVKSSMTLDELMDQTDIHQYELWLAELREASRGWRDKDKDVELDR